MATPRARPHRIATLLIALAGCDPYQRFGQGDGSLGPVDPVNFPPANLGARGDRTRAGAGSFTAVKAFVGGQDTAYFAYPLPPAAPMSDPLAVASLGAAPAYAFDQKCQAPPNYAWDPPHMQTDEVRLDQQGAIFTALPRATYAAGVPAMSTYSPVVQRIPVSAPGQPCQKLKSAEMVTKAGLGGMPDGHLLAWLIIDPAAPVYAPGKSAANDPGIGLQSWGWYNRYLLAYLDGGEIPFGDETVMDAMGMRTVSRVKAQKLYYPRSMVTMTKANPDGTMTTTMAPGKLGAGYDVLQARRGQPGYSPLCQVLTYDAGAPLDAAVLPRDAAIIEMTFPPEVLLPASPPYVYCLQVSP
jgi:hypothetical protein